VNPAREHPPVSLSARISSIEAPQELTALQQWRVQRHLGTGATAQVWLLAHTSDQYTVACKTPKAPDDLAALSHEAELAHTLSHENLVRPLFAETQLGLSPTESAVGTFWEFLPGGSLASLIGAVGQLSIAQTVTVLLPMIQVTQYLHQHQIVHGDIAPANILFALNGRPVLSDLGAVRATAHAYHHTGTPGFMAPEIHDQGQEFEGLGAAADVYSLGAIGWFCLTGTIPGSPEARMPLVTLQPAIDEEIATVLEACLAAEPLLRPTMKQLLTSVAQWATPEPVDLFAAVGEEYELLLPTRKPQALPRSRAWKLRRKRTTVRPSPAQASPKEDEVAGVGRRRLVLGLAAGALVAGVAATAYYVDPVSVQGEETAQEAVTQTVVDFQSVVDSIAQARSAAWASADASQVPAYALETSEVFAADTDTLTSLHELENALEGIRMRAVVKGVDRSRETAVVEVEWHTGAYEQRDKQQRLLNRTDARTERLDLYLVDTGQGWKLSAVEPVATS